MCKINAVTIRRFKRLEDLHVKIKDITVLIGANNSGKSSVLQALHFAVSVSQTAKLIGEGVTWGKDMFRLSFNPSQLLYSPIADVMSLANGEVLQEQHESRIEIELCESKGKRCTVTLKRGRNRNIAVSIEGRELGERLMNLEQPFTVYAPGLAGISKEERFLSPGVVRRIVARGDANLVLRNVLHMLSQDKTAWEIFNEDMQAIFPGISIAISFDQDTDENIQAFLNMRDASRLPLDAAGTSILQATQILAYICLFRPSVLILDEPDSHLHPNNQRALCDLVFRLAQQRDFQVLMSTHSRHVIDAMRNRSSVIWLSCGRQVPETDMCMTAALLELGALDSVDYFANGELRCLVATEDTNKEPLKALLCSNGFNEKDTEVASYTGCSKVDSAKMLSSFLKGKAPNVRVIIHRDRDYMNEAREAKFKKELEDVDIMPFLTDFSDIEGYFLNADHLNHVNPSVTQIRVQEIIDEATLMTKEKSIEALINQRTSEAIQDRSGNGSQINPGKIAAKAREDYEADPLKWRRGKIVIGQVTAMLQKEIKSNPNIFVPSPHLRSPSLSDYAKNIDSKN